MRTGIVVEVTTADRARLQTVMADRNSPQKHVWRAEIVLLSADGVGTVEIMRRTGKSKTRVWRWQARYAQVAREMRQRIKGRFDYEGIEIPLPQRVVWHREAAGVPQPASAPDTAAPQPKDG